MSIGAARIASLANVARKRAEASEADAQALRAFAQANEAKARQALAENEGNRAQAGRFKLLADKSAKEAVSLSKAAADFRQELKASETLREQKLVEEMEVEKQRESLKEQVTALTKERDSLKGQVDAFPSIESEMKQKFPSGSLYHAGEWPESSDPARARMAR